MPAQALVYSLITAGTIELGSVYASLALIGAAAIDSLLLGSLLAKDIDMSDYSKQTLVVRSASEPHKIVYGREMVGGTAILVEVLDRYYLSFEEGSIVEKYESGAYLNMAVAIAAHEIDAFEEIYIGEDLVFKVDQVTNKLELVNNKYEGYIEFLGLNGKQTTADPFILANIDRHFDGPSATDTTLTEYYAPYGVTSISNGIIDIDTTKKWPGVVAMNLSGSWQSCTTDPSDPAGTICTYNSVNHGTTATGIPFVKSSKGGHEDPAEGRPWTVEHVANNTAIAYFRFRYNRDLYRGIPKIRCVIRGKHVYDPRKNLTGNYTGAWVGNTAYTVNDVIDSPNNSGVQYICIKAHTSYNSAFDYTVFKNDFIDNEYWDVIQTPDNPDSWQWSDNWALCVRDYLTSGEYYARTDSKRSLYGIGVKREEIDDNNIIEAANISDEIVYYDTAISPIAQDAWDSSTNTKTIYLSGDKTDFYVKYEELEVEYVYNSVVYTSVSSLRAILPTLAIGKYNSTTVLMSTVAEKYTDISNIILDSSYDIVTNRTKLVLFFTKNVSVNTIRLKSRRFTANGVVNTANSPIDVLEALLSAGAGFLPYTQGIYKVIPGVYITPTITINENNLAGPIGATGSLSAQNLINTVVGTIRNAAAKWEETDFPLQTSSQYIAEDGGYELIHNASYPFTTSNFDAQRLARITLQRARFGTSATLVCNLSALNIPIGTNIKVNIDRLGWVDQVFRVIGWSLEGSVVKLELRQDDPSAYVWDSATLVPIPYTPTSGYEAIPDLSPVSGLTLDSGTSTLEVKSDGTIIPRVKVSWISNTVDDRAKTELRVNINGKEEYSILLDSYITEYYIRNVRENDSVIVYATVVHRDPNIDAKSNTIISAPHVVVGKSQPPSNVQNFTYSVSAKGITFVWDKVSDLDISKYEIRHGTTWDTASIVAVVDTTSYFYGIEDISNTFFIKAIDTSDNYSISAASLVIDVSNTASQAPTNLAISIDDGIYTISWGKPVINSVDIKYYNIYIDHPVTGFSLITSTDSLSFSNTVSWVGTAQFYVEAVNYVGEISVRAQVSSTIAIPSTPSITYSINQEAIELTWSTPAASLPIDYYNIYIKRSGEPTETLLSSESSNFFSFLADYSDSAIFYVEAVDIRGNISNKGQVAVPIAVYEAINITSQVIDNNVLLKWTEPSLGSLPIVYYEIRKGTTYSTSEFIAYQSGTFAAIFESASGSYSYWVTAVDSAGNFGTPNNITVEVNQPPDFIIHSDTQDDFSGTLENVIVKENKLIFLAKATETWEQHFLNNGFNSIEAQIVAGYPYYLQPTYNYNDTITNINNKQCTVTNTAGLSPGFKLRISGLPTELEDGIYTVSSVDSTTTFTVVESISNASNISAIVKAGAQYINTIDYGTVLNNLSVSLNITSPIISGNPSIHFRVGISTDNVTYTWFPMDLNNVFAVTFRYVRFKIEAEADTGDDLVTVSNIHTVISIKEKTDAGKVQVTTNPTSVTFNKNFVDISSITVSPNSTSNFIAVYDFVDTPNPSGFDIYLYDSSGNPVAGEVSWIARGY